MLKTSHSLTLILLLAFLAAAITGFLLTGRSPAPVTSAKPAASAAQSKAKAVIDQERLSTARSLAALAATPEEQRLAADAVRSADAEVDTAFSSTLRATSNQSNAGNPKTAPIEERIRQTEAAIESNQQKVARLTAETKTAKEEDQEALQNQMEVAQAELDLDQDALADAKQDLIRAGGDAHSQIQELLEEHEALEHSESSGAVTVSTPSPAISIFTATSLVGRWREWSALGFKGIEIAAAGDAARNAANSLGDDHKALEARVQTEQPQKTGATKEAVDSLRRLSTDEKDLADFDKRIQDLNELSSTYDDWVALVGAQQRSALHAVLGSALWILFTLLAAFLAHHGIDRLFVNLNLERKQRSTLRAVLRFSVEVLAVVVILFVIFGAPSQLSTVLGLAGAGLTVALKDFIVSFLGWFVLMGRNGVHVGDWVEINGVRGEVVELGLLRTVLLETGNWTDAGQPTGRQVAFLNTYAVEGYYFNFTTSGQWLWDELQATIPAGRDPYPLIEKIREVVAKETESNEHEAEQEWQRVTRRYGIRSLSAGPSVNVTPTDGGVRVIVRYVTHAHERSDVRYRLNHAVVELLHGAKAPVRTGRDS